MFSSTSRGADGALRSARYLSMSASVTRVRWPDFALTHPLQQDLVAQVGAKAREVDAFGAQPLAQLGHAHLVLRRDALHRAVDLGVVDPHAASRA